MSAVWEIIVPIAPFGIAFLVVGGIILLLGAIVLQKAQKSAERAAVVRGYDDPDDDPAVTTVSRNRKLALIGGAVLVALGAIITSSPAWSTILV